MGYFWKEKNCFAKEKLKFHLKIITHIKIICKLWKENSTLKLLIKVTRGKILSIWTIKLKHLLQV